ncbi:hypothetical protein [Streptomyces sp. NRRL S-146]|uniref:hypothetical protein n=1 Tax=Streptomyces sp. NRRL S-146 TaxID=1463884 RepID=UPI001F35573D|nr:hypothetical protein [Streptomyces sp. NRRL S-146]
MAASRPIFLDLVLERLPVERAGEPAGQLCRGAGTQLDGQLVGGVTASEPHDHTTVEQQSAVLNSLGMLGEPDEALLGPASRLGQRRESTSDIGVDIDFDLGRKGHPPAPVMIASKGSRRERLEGAVARSVERRL